MRDGANRKLVGAALQVRYQDRFFVFFFFLDKRSNAFPLFYIALLYGRAGLERSFVVLMLLMHALSSRVFPADGKQSKNMKKAINKRRRHLCPSVFLCSGRFSRADAEAMFKTLYLLDVLPLSRPKIIACLVTRALYNSKARDLNM